MNQATSPQGNFKNQESIGETLLDKEKMSRNEDTVTFDITYYLAFMVFQNIRNILEELHILLAPDDRKVQESFHRFFQNSFQKR